VYYLEKAIEDYMSQSSSSQEETILTTAPQQFNPVKTILNLGSTYNQIGLACKVGRSGGGRGWMLMVVVAVINGVFGRMRRPGEGSVGVVVIVVVVVIGIKVVFR